MLHSRTCMTIGEKCRQIVFNNCEAPPRARCRRETRRALRNSSWSWEASCTNEFSSQHPAWVLKVQPMQSVGRAGAHFQGEAREDLICTFFRSSGPPALMHIIKRSGIEAASYVRNETQENEERTFYFFQDVVFVLLNLGNIRRNFVNIRRWNQIFAKFKFRQIVDRLFQNFSLYI